MVIRVRGHLTFRKIIGTCQYDFPDEEPLRLYDFMRFLASEVGGEHGGSIFDEENGTVGPYIAIMLNGRHYNHLPDKLNTIMKDQDEVSIFPPGAGG